MYLSIVYQFCTLDSLSRLSVMLLDTVLLFYRRILNFGVIYHLLYLHVNNECGGKVRTKLRRARKRLQRFTYQVFGIDLRKKR